MFTSERERQLQDRKDRLKAQRRGYNALGDDYERGGPSSPSSSSGDGYSSGGSWDLNEAHQDGPDAFQLLYDHEKFERLSKHVASHSRGRDANAITERLRNKARTKGSNFRKGANNLIEQHKDVRLCRCYCVCHAQPAAQLAAHVA